MCLGKAGLSKVQKGERGDKEGALEDNLYASCFGDSVVSL